MRREYVINEEMERKDALSITPSAGIHRGYTVFPLIDCDESELPPGGSYRLSMSEQGGGMTNTGTATCVASPSGEALDPHFVPRAYAGSSHAHFVGTSFLIAEVSRQRSQRDGILYEVSIDETTGEVSKEILWEGEWTAGSEGPFVERVGLPTKLDYAAAVLEAASVKAGCYHCRHVHFAKREE